MATHLDAEKTFYDGETLQLTMVGGDTCQQFGTNRTAVITFSCSQSAGNGRPVFVKETECTYHYSWPSTLACPRVAPLPLPDRPPMPEDGKVFSGNISIGAKSTTN